MKKLIAICIILAAIICLIGIITYEPPMPTENQPLECDFDLPNVTDSYLNDSEDNETHTTRPIHHTTTSYSYDEDDSYDDAIGDDYYYDDAYYDDKYGDSWEYDDEESEY